MQINWKGLPPYGRDGCNRFEDRIEHDVPALLDPRATHDEFI